MYKRTVHCKYCYKEGHNRRTCPALQETAKTNPESWAAKEVMRNAEKGKDRVCTYCKNPGHNIATCENLKGDRFGALVNNQNFRKEMWNKLVQHGIGVGTLLCVKYTNSWNADQPRLYVWNDQGYFIGEKILMVEGIKWDDIIYHNADKALIVNEYGENRDNMNFSINEKFFEWIQQGLIKVEVAAEPHNIGLGKPDDWEKGISNMKKAFERWD